MDAVLKYLLLTLPFASAFLIGSIPTSYLLVKIKTGQDIRKLGSGNAGATNVFRSVGRGEGLTVLFADFFKGTAAVIILSKLIEFPYTSPQTYQFLIGLAAILGHVFTPFLGFKGGKGVAAAGGVALAIYPVNFLLTLAVWAGVLFTTKYMSLASITAGYVFALSAFFTMQNRFHIFLSILCAVSSLGPTARISGVFSAEKS